MMLEVLFARQQQEQAFLTLLACGLLLGLLLHLGQLLRRHGLLRALWDVLTSVCGGGMLLVVILRFHSGLRAYGLLGMLLGCLLYLAGPAQLVQAAAGFFQKYKDSRPPKAGDSTANDESKVQKT